MKYEIMFIVRANLEEGELAGIVKNFEEILTKNGAKIESSKEMGQRELAYEINKFKTGYYFFYEVEADALAIAEFNRVVGINECVLRHLVVKKED